MEVLSLCCLWVVLVASGASLPSDLTHVEAFLASTNYNMRRKFRPVYHLASPYGWLNDPAAFVFFKRKFHIFYQYHPYDGAWGPMHWGHAVSGNLIDWVHYPPTLLPRDPYDRYGCLAGSVVEHNDYLAIFYTGHRQLTNNSQNTINVAISSDGIIFQKYLYNPIIRGGPPKTDDFRNPKVWLQHNKWFMLVGASIDHRGHLLLYVSPDLYNWTLNKTVAESYGDMGYMWESPDVFELDGLTVLLLSVQGLSPESDRFKNLYTTGYVVGHFHHRTAAFDELEVSTATFNELDHGHDFYAPKTMITPDGRRLLIAWLGMWESDFIESKDGWAGMMSIVRELHLGRYGELVMTPVREAIELRDELLEEAWYNPGESFSAGTKSFELLVNSSATDDNVAITLEWGERQFTIAYLWQRGYVAIDRGGIDGVRRADWKPKKHIFWRIFVDRSSVEVFCGGGEVVFSSRIYPIHPISVKVSGEAKLHITQYRLRRSIGYDVKLHQYLTNHVIFKDTNHLS